MRTKEKRKGRMTVVLLAVILIVAVLATIALTQKSNAPTDLADVKEGECFLGDDLNDLEVVDCRADHNGQVFKLVPAPEPDGAFPDDATLQTLRDTCTVELAGFFGAGPEVAVENDFDLFPTVPNEAQWNDGQTDTICVLGKADRSVYKGTLENAGADAAAG